MMISECGSFRVNTLVIINLFVFPINFGDAILNTYDQRKLASMVKVNQNFDTNSGIASSFHRIMRKVNKDVNPNAANELMASVRVKTALEAAINRIVTIYVTKISGICDNSLTSTYKQSNLVMLCKFIVFTVYKHGKIYRGGWDESKKSELMLLLAYITAIHQWRRQATIFFFFFWGGGQLRSKPIFFFGGGGAIKRQTNFLGGQLGGKPILF